jgi:Domain of unknown function (DUF4337)
MEEPEVPTEHLHEHIHEHAEHSTERWILGVALSSALLAAFAAVASLLAGHNANEAVISQIESSDQWSYYQSKSIKEAQIAGKLDILAALDKPVADTDKSKVAQYEKEKEDVRKDAERLEKESKHLLRTHEALAVSVTLFQIAIAVGAISVLIKRKSFWSVSLVAGLIGVGFFLQALLFVH